MALHLGVYPAGERGTTTAPTLPSSEGTKQDASAWALRVILQGRASQRLPQQATAIASSSVRDQGWCLPFSWQPEEPPDGQRETREGEVRCINLSPHNC